MDHLPRCNSAFKAKESICVVKIWTQAVGEWTIWWQGQLWMGLKNPTKQAAACTALNIMEYKVRRALLSQLKAESCTADSSLQRSIPQGEKKKKIGVATSRPSLNVQSFP